MTATTAAPVRIGPSPADTARRVVWAVVLVNLVAVELLLVHGGQGKNLLLTIGRFFGLHAALIMMFQLVLVARLPWLDRRLGMDRLTGWHRWTGFTLLWTVVLHATFIVLGFARLDHASPLGTLGSLAAVPASLLGIVAAGIVIAIGITSARYARRRLSYEAWHALHLALYAALLLSLVHQLLEGTAFTGSPVAAAYWWTLWALVGLALIGGRVVLPLWRNAYHRFEVSAVVPEAGGATSVHVTGRHLDRLPAQAGQFFIWRFPSRFGWWQANPFSLSAAPDGTVLRLTAKASGTTSAALKELAVGSRVFAEGPYGAFTDLHRTRPATLLIAGGVGVTPIRALLQEAAGPVVVLYRVREEADAVLLDELRALSLAKGARLHLLTGPSAAGNPLATARLAELVPDVRERDVYVCGPPAMTRAVLRSLRELGVPGRQLHAERFALAG